MSSEKHSTSQPSDQPLLLAAWSVTTPAYVRYNNLPYTDTCKSKWERQSVAASHKAAEMRKSVDAMERTVAKLETLQDEPYTAAEAERDIRAAGVPYSYVRSMTKYGFTRESVATGIKAYFALKAITEQKNAAKLAQIMAVQL